MTNLLSDSPSTKNDIGGYLIYHPKRCSDKFGGVTVYYDKPGKNQDPYVWNRTFLHTYCHITQMSPQEGHINFWVCGDTFPAFNQLLCDLVFVVGQKIPWDKANRIDPDHGMVDSGNAFQDHYQWAMQEVYAQG